MDRRGFETVAAALGKRGDRLIYPKPDEGVSEEFIFITRGGRKVVDSLNALGKAGLIAAESVDAAPPTMDPSRPLLKPIGFTQFGVALRDLNYRA